MRISKLFRIPDGEKVTEKALRKVLISSICSIVLCMTCLVSTTWAWFAVSIVNEENVIAIWDPDVVATENNIKLTSGNPLEPGTHKISITHANDPDDLQKKSTLHVTFSVDDVVAGRIVLDEKNQYKTEITVVTDKTCKLTWDVSWFAPDGAEELTDNTITLMTAEDPTEPSTEAATEPSTEPTEETTEPADATSEPTGEPNEPEGEETDPTEAAEETTESTEETDETTVETSEPEQT